MQLKFPLPLAKMGAMLVCGALTFAASLSADAQTLRVGGTGSALGTVRLMADAFTRQGSTQAGVTLVPNLGSSGALRALQAGAIDAALISRPLKAEETAAGLVGFEYGRSPFVFVTSKSGVKNITAATVADVLSGRTASWPDGQPVRFVLRPQSDGDNVLLASLSPDIATALKIAHQRPGMVMAPNDQDAADEAERLPGSLAANTLALVLSERRKLNVIAFDGVVPSATALAAGTYPYFKRLVIVTRGAPSGALRQFIDYFKSPPGRAILEANGHFVAS
jgi:phosphate transport system substrate-binding protein